MINGSFFIVQIMNEPIKKIRGVGSKVQSYLKAMHPEMSSKTSVQDLLSKYPQYEELVSAIQQHDPNVKGRSMSSIRSNLRGAYEYMSLLGEHQQSGPKRKRNEEEQGEHVEEMPSAKKTALEQMVLPNSLSVGSVVETGDVRVENRLDALVTEQMKSKVMGDQNPKLSEGVSNIEQPLPTYSISQKNYPLTDAVTEGKAIDLAEADPIKPTKELEFIPDAHESTLLTIQEDNFQETRNAGRLLHTTILPAAALVPNDGGGAREGIRRSDNDLEVEEESKESKDEGKEVGVGGGSSVGAGTQPAPFTQLPQGELDQTFAQMMKSGNYGKLINTGLDVAGAAANAAMMMGARNLDGFMSPVGNQGAAAMAAATMAKPWVDSAVEKAKFSSEKILDTMNIRNRMRQQGISSDKIEQFLQHKEMTEGKTEQETKYRRVVVDELRPFFPIAGSADVELDPGDVEQKKRNAALFANYKPPNWPLGNMDNQLYFQNLVLQGVKWMSPLDSVPPVLPGGTLYGGSHDFGNEVILPSDDVLSDLGVRSQVEFRLRFADDMVNKLRCHHAEEARKMLVLRDTKFIHNPMALGVDSSMENMQSDMNPLANRLHRDLRVGGSRELRPIMPMADAFTLDYQPGFQRALLPSISYMTSPSYNYYGIYPGVY